MSSNRQGHIVSITASIAVRPNVTVPALLPSLIAGGIHHATRSLAIELAAHNVKVNAVAPPIVNTSSHAGGTLETFKGVAPGGAINTAQQIVDAVLYLTDSEFTTGIVISAGGVFTAGT
jgi:NAD(P)-dependent dehydrogenase (short-subunit alcohol dehydrogenase family)